MAVVYLCNGCRCELGDVQQNEAVNVGASTYLHATDGTDATHVQGGAMFKISGTFCWDCVERMFAGCKIPLECDGPFDYRYVDKLTRDDVMAANERRKETNKRREAEISAHHILSNEIADELRKDEQ